jgi:thioesterase domain-containing protein
VGDGDGAGLRDYLRGVLPGHLVPSVVVWLAALPLGPSGKVDRRALPAPAGIAGDVAGYRAPRDGIELALQQIWRGLLPVDDIGIGDNFFDLGGHSLLAVSLMSRCNRMFRTDLPLRLLFEKPTIEGMAAILRGQKRPAAFSPLVPLRPDGFKPPLFCVHPAGGTVFCYMNLARSLAPDQPVYGLQASGLEPDEPLAQSIAQMAEGYLAAIRSVRPHGPYHLLGWSFGGLVAQAIACRLREMGETVALLALLDTSPLAEHGGSVPDDRAILAELGNVLALAGPGTPLAASIDNVPDLIEAARASGMFPSDFSAAQAERLLAVYGRTVRLPLGHRPERYQGDTMLFAAAESSDPEQLTERWRPFIAGAITTIAIPCGHERMTAPDSAARIAAALAAAIQSDLPQPDGELVAAK